MNTFMQTFFESGGIACNASLLKQEKGVVLFGGFVESFHHILKNMDFKTDSTERSIFLLSPLHFNPFNFTQFVYEVGSEEAVIALLAYGLSTFGGKNLQDFSKTFDVGYFASECNFSEEELEEIVQIYEKFGLIFLVGEDLVRHKNVKNIARILALLSVELKNLKVVFLESKIEKTFIKNSEITPLNSLESYDGLVVYVRENIKKGSILEVSKQFCMVSKMQDGAKVKIKLESNQEVVAQMQCNVEIKGMVGILWTPVSILQEDFCYQLVSLSKAA